MDGPRGDDPQIRGYHGAQQRVPCAGDLFGFAAGVVLLVRVDHDHRQPGIGIGGEVVEHLSETVEEGLRRLGQIAGAMGRSDQLRVFGCGDGAVEIGQHATQCPAVPYVEVVGQVGIADLCEVRRIGSEKKWFVELCAARAGVALLDDGCRARAQCSESRFD